LFAICRHALPKQEEMLQLLLQFQNQQSPFDVDGQTYSLALACALGFFALVMVGFAIIKQQYASAALYFLLSTCSVVSMIYDRSLKIAFRTLGLCLIFLCLLGLLGILAYFIRNQRSIKKMNLSLKKEVNDQNLIVILFFVIQGIGCLVALALISRELVMDWNAVRPPMIRITYFVV
jgi:hypothetical protein